MVCVLTKHTDFPKTCPYNELKNHHYLIRVPGHKLYRLRIIIRYDRDIRRRRNVIRNIRLRKLCKILQFILLATVDNPSTQRQQFLIFPYFTRVCSSTTHNFLIYIPDKVNESDFYRFLNVFNIEWYKKSAIFKNN